MPRGEERAKMSSGQAAKIKHIEMVQEIISRQAHNSFLVKGWSLALVTIVFAFVGTQATSENVVRYPWLILFVLIPVSIFWQLDALFLTQERLFRKLHEAIAEDIRENTERVKLFELGTQPYVSQVPSRLRAAFSATVFPVHLAAALSVMLLVVLVPR